MFTIGILYSGTIFLDRGPTAYCDAIRMPDRTRCSLLPSFPTISTKSSGKRQYPNVHCPKILTQPRRIQANLRATLVSGSCGKNDDGGRAYLADADSGLADSGGFAVYLLLLSRLNLFLILLVILTATADFFVSHYIGEREYRHRRAREL